MKKYFAIITAAILFLSPLAAEAALSRVQSSAGKNTTFASSVQTGAFASPLTNNSIILVCGENDTGAANSFNTPTDTAGNTYTRIMSKSVAATFNMEIWYTINTHTTASNKVTMTDTTGGVDSIAIAEEWTGEATTNTIDASSSNSGVGASLTSGSFTTTNANDLIWGCGSLAAGANDFSAGTGYSNVTQTSTAFSNVGIESQIVSVAQAYNVPATSSASLSWAMGGVGIKQAAAAAGATKRRRSMIIVSN